jgi:hypothetical protein
VRIRPGATMHNLSMYTTNRPSCDRLTVLSPNFKEKVTASSSPDPNKWPCPTAPTHRTDRLTEC